MLNRLKAATAAMATAGALAFAGVGTAQASVDVGSQATPIGGTGTMTFTATAPSSRLVVAGLALNCAVTSGSGVATTGVYSTFPAAIAKIQPIFGSTGTPCVGPSGFNFTVACTAHTSASAANLNITSDVPTSVGPPAVWSGTITGISCTITFSALGCSATASGSVAGTYTNPTASVAGKLTVFSAGQSLNVSGSTCPAAVLPNGAAQFGGTGATPTTVSNLVYTLDGASTAHPFVTRT